MKGKNLQKVQASKKKESVYVRVGVSSKEEEKFAIYVLGKKWVRCSTIEATRVYL